MTRLITTGFEHGIVSYSGGGVYYGTSGTFAIESSKKRFGNYSIKGTATTAAATRMSWAVTNGDWLNIYKLVGRFYIYFDVLPDTLTRLGRFLCTGTSPAIYFDPADNKIYPYIGTAGTKLATVLTTGQWYRIDFKADCSVNPNTMDLQLDGLAATQKTYAQAASYITQCYLGMYDAAIGTFYIDDVELDDDDAVYPIGQGFVSGLSPASDGTHNAGTNVIEANDGTDIGTATAYNLIDDVPMDSTTDYIQQVATGTGNYAEVNFADTIQLSPTSARAILAYMASGTTANTGGTVIIDEDGSNIVVWGGSGSGLADYSETSLFYKSKILPAPAGGWDASAINALKARMGYSDNVATTPYWESLMVEVGFSGEYYHGSLTIANASNTTTSDTVTISNFIQPRRMSNFAAMVEYETQHVSRMSNFAAMLEYLDVPMLVIEDGTHVTTSENVTLTAYEPPAPELTIQDDLQGIVSENVVLVQHLIIVITDSNNTLVSENITLTYHSGTITLTVADSVHKNFSGVDGTGDYALREQYFGLYGIPLKYFPYLAYDKISLVTHQAISGETATNIITSENITLMAYAPSWALIVDDSNHLITSENIVLVAHIPTFALVISNSENVVASDNISLVQHQILTVSDSTNITTSETASLIQHQIITISDSTNTTASGNITIGGIDVMPNMASHAHTVENVILTQHYVLAISDSTNALTSDNVIVTSRQSLVIADSTNAITTETLVLAQHQSLTISDSTNVLTSDNVSLVQHQILTVSGTINSVTSENVALVQHQILSVSDCSNTHTSENITVTLRISIVIDDGTHALSSGSNIVTDDYILREQYFGYYGFPLKYFPLYNVGVITLTVHTPIGTIGINNANNLITSDNISLVQHHSLVIHDSTNAVSSSNITIGGIEVVPDIIVNAVTSDNISLTQHQAITINDSSNIVTSDNVALSQHQTVIVADASNVIVSENITLTQHHALAIADTAHAVTSDNITLTAYTPAGVLGIHNSSHALSSENISLVQHHALSIFDSGHVNYAENVSAGQSFVLIINNSAHTLYSDLVILLQHLIVSINNSENILYSDSIELAQHIAIIINNALHIIQSENIIVTAYMPSYAIDIQDSEHVLYSTHIPMITGELLFYVSMIGGMNDYSGGMRG